MEQGRNSGANDIETLPLEGAEFPCCDRICDCFRKPLLELLEFRVPSLTVTTS